MLSTLPIADARTEQLLRVDLAPMEEQHRSDLIAHARNHAQQIDDLRMEIDDLGRDIAILKKAFAPSQEARTYWQLVIKITEGTQSHIGR